MLRRWVGQPPNCSKTLIRGRGGGSHVSSTGVVLTFSGAYLLLATYYAPDCRSSRCSPCLGRWNLILDFSVKSEDLWGCICLVVFKLKGVVVTFCGRDRTFLMFGVHGWASPRRPLTTIMMKLFFLMSKPTVRFLHVFFPQAKLFR